MVKEIKPTTNYIYEARSGEDAGTIWDDARYTWDAALIYWDDLLSTTVFSKETKPTTNYTKETKP